MGQEESGDVSFVLYQIIEKGGCRRVVISEEKLRFDFSVDNNRRDQVIIGSHH